MQANKKEWKPPVHENLGDIQKITQCGHGGHHHGGCCCSPCTCTGILPLEVDPVQDLDTGTL